MRTLSWLLTVLLAAVIIAPVAVMQERGGQEEFGPYLQPAANWPLPLPGHDGWTWGSTGAVFAETPDRIWIAQRGELPLPPWVKPFTPYSMLNPSRGNATGGDDTKGTRGWERRYHHVLFVVNRDGKALQSWQQHDALFAKPGAWTAQDQDEPIRSSKACVGHRRQHASDLQVHLRRQARDDARGRAARLGAAQNHFSRPTDIAWLPDGTFFVSDGYVSVRVAKFDPNGKFLLDWGTAPKDPAKPGPNEFNTVHSVAVSKDRRVVVADRGHKRFQIFDENGKFLDMFSTGPNSSPYYHLITADQHIWMADGGTDRIVKYDLKGKYLYGWGGPGGGYGQFSGPHQLSVDQEGNLYAARCTQAACRSFGRSRAPTPRSWSVRKCASSLQLKVPSLTQTRGRRTIVFPRAFLSSRLTFSGSQLAPRAYRELKLRPSRPAARRDLSAMAFNDGFDDGESKPAAAGHRFPVRGSRGVGLVEPIEHARQVFRRDAGPLVRHGHGHTPLPRAGSELDRGAARRISYGVGSEILERLLQPIAIAAHTLRAWLHNRLDHDPRSFVLLLVPRRDACENFFDRHVRHRERAATALEPGRIQQVADDAVQALGFIVDDAEIPHACDLVDSKVRHGQGFKIAPHGGDWCRQLVGDVGKELPTRAIGRSQTIGHVAGEHYQQHGRWSARLRPIARVGSCLADVSHELTTPVTAMRAILKP